jgi:hypothetical protein
MGMDQNSFFQESSEATNKTRISFRQLNISRKSIDVRKSSKISNKDYQQLINDEQRRQVELFQDIKEGLFAEDSLHIIIKQKITEIQKQFKLPPCFIKEFEQIRDLICPPEQIFACSEHKPFVIVQSPLDESCNTLENYQKIIDHLIVQLRHATFEPYNKANERLQHFINKWTGFIHDVNHIQSIAKQILWFESEWKIFVNQFRNQPLKVNGKKFYKWLNDCNDYHNKLQKILRDFKTKKILESDYDTIQVLINFFQQRGEALWEVAKLNVDDLHPSLFALNEHAFNQGEPLQEFLGYSNEEDKQLNDIPVSLLNKLLQPFSLPSSWKEKVDTLDKNLRAFRNVKHIVTALSTLQEYHKKFHGVSQMDPSQLDDVLSPWCNGIIDGRPIRLPRPVAQKVLGFDSSTRPNVGAPFSISTDGFIFTKLDFHGLLEVNMLYWLGRLFNLPCDQASFGIFANSPSFGMTDDPIQKSTMKYFMVQKRSEDIQFSDFLSKVVSGQTAFESISPNTAGIHFLYCLLMRSVGFPFHFRLVPNNNLFDIKLDFRDFSSAGSYLNMIEGKSTNTSNHDLYLYFSTLIDQEIPKDVKIAFQSHDIFYLLLNLNNRMRAFEDNLKKYRMAEEENASAKIYDRFAGAIPNLLTIFKNMSKILNTENVSYGYIFRETQPVAFDYCMSIYNESIQAINNQKAKLFFEQYMDLTINDLSNLITQAIKYGLKFSNTNKGPEILQNELLKYSVVKRDIIRESSSQVHESGNKTCDELINDISDEQTKKFFIVQYSRAQQVGFFEAHALLKALSIINKRQAFIRQDVLPSSGTSRGSMPFLRSEPIPHHLDKSHSLSISPQKPRSSHSSSLPMPISREDLQDGHHNPFITYSTSTTSSTSSFTISGQLQFPQETLTLSSVSPLRTKPRTPSTATITLRNPYVDELPPSMRLQLIKWADLTDRPISEVIEILDLLLSLDPHNNYLLNTIDYHESWAIWITQSENEFLALPEHVQSLFQQILVRTKFKFDQDAFRENHLSVIRGAQKNQWEFYKKVTQQFKPTKSEQKSSQPSENIAIQLYEKLWQGSLSLTSDEDQITLTAFCDLLNLRNLGFASHKQRRDGPVEYRSTVGTYHITYIPESWAKLFGSSCTFSYEFIQTIQSHNWTLLHLSFLACIKDIDPTVTFQPWYGKLLQKSENLSTRLSENPFLTFDQLLEMTWPEFYCKLQQTFQNEMYDRNKALKKVREGLDNLSGLDITDLDWTPTGHDKNLGTILGDWDKQREVYQSSPPLSLSDIATTTFNRFQHKTSMLDTDGKLLELEHEIVKLATKLDIHAPSVTNKAWKDMRLLKALLKAAAPYDQIRLAIALYLGCDVGNITYDNVTSDNRLLKITGLMLEMTKVSLESKHSPLFKVLSAFVDTKTAIQTLDLSGNNIHAIDLQLISCIATIKDIYKLILSHNPIHDLTLFDDLRNNDTLSEIELVGTYAPQYSPFTISFPQCQNRKITWGPTKRNCFNLAEEDKRSILQYLFIQLRNYQANTHHKNLLNKDKLNIVTSILEDLSANFWEESLGAREFFLTSVSMDTLFLALEECNRYRKGPQNITNIISSGNDANTIRSLSEALPITPRDKPRSSKIHSDGEGTLYWERRESCESSSSSHNGNNDGWFDVVNEDKGHENDRKELKEKRSKKEFKKTKGDKEIHITTNDPENSFNIFLTSHQDHSKDVPHPMVQDMAFKLLFTLKYLYWIPGILPEHFGFSKGSDDTLIITNDPYCLTSLTISCDLSNIPLSLLSQFSGTYKFNNLGANPVQGSLRPSNCHEISVCLMAGGSTGLQDNSTLICSRHDDKEQELIHNDNLKQFMKTTKNTNLLSRLRISVEEKSSFTSQDSSALTKFLVQSNFILSGLKKLNLSGTNILTIDSIPVMHSLEMLDLSNNKFTSFEGFFFKVNEKEGVYKFPNLRWLSLKRNSISITPQEYEPIQNHFNNLIALDLSYNQLTFAPTMGKKWFKRKPKEHLSIAHNNIPISELHKFYFMTFCDKDPVDIWQIKAPKRNSMYIFMQEQNRSQRNYCCRIFGHKNQQNGLIKLPVCDDTVESQSALEIYNLRLLGHESSGKTSAKDITISEKSGIIKYIIEKYAPMSLNTEFLTIWPQAECSLTLNTSVSK